MGKCQISQVGFSGLRILYKCQPSRKLGRLKAVSVRNDGGTNMSNISRLCASVKYLRLISWNELRSKSGTAAACEGAGCDAKDHDHHDDDDGGNGSFVKSVYENRNWTTSKGSLQNNSVKVGIMSQPAWPLPESWDSQKGIGKII